jgi:hypothetical protein
MYCNFMSPAGRKRSGNNDNLVPVIFPVKDVFPHRQKCLKQLLAALEFWWDSKEIFGMPKGGYGIDCPWLFVAVLPRRRGGMSSHNHANVIVC